VLLSHWVLPYLLLPLHHSRLAFLKLSAGEGGGGGDMKGEKVTGSWVSGKRGDSGWDMTDMGSLGSGLDSEPKGIQI
jgi:hypothetical protein